MAYLQGASISNRIRKSIYKRLDCIRLVLQYLTEEENHYICVYGVFAWFFNISQGKKIIIDALRVN